MAHLGHRYYKSGHDERDRERLVRERERARSLPAIDPFLRSLVRLIFGTFSKKRSFLKKTSFLKKKRHF